jgi:hypothetical protein
VFVLWPNSPQDQRFVSAISAIERGNDSASAKKRVVRTSNPLGSTGVASELEPQRELDQARGTVETGLGRFNVPDSL